jgi:hypothetical protein
VPFIRHSRDRRGFECTYLMHAYRPAMPGPQQMRVLYLFRSPAHLRIGRRPLDPEVMEALEHTHPDLAFDWPALQRESSVARVEARDRDMARDRGRGGRPAARQPAPAAAPVRPKPVPDAQDRSILARTLGAPEAARLRGRFEQLLLRIARRSRTPEDRDRLAEAAQRLNPDSWADTAAVRAGVQEVEARWDAILAELPSRRRGRRGGRRRPDGAIMADDAGLSTGSQHASLDSSTRDSGDPDDGGGVGPAGPDADARLLGED